MKAFPFLFCVLMSLASSQTSLNVELLGNYQGHRDKNNQSTYYSSGWGYYDNAGKEYAFLGGFNGTSVVDLSYLPDSLHEISFIAGPHATYSYREMKTYLHYLYIVSEGGAGVQIVDLSFLPDSAHFIRSYTDSTFTRAHTVSESDGTLFTNGGNSTAGMTNAGGTRILSLADPEVPVKLGAFGTWYVHDAYARGNRLFTAHVYGTQSQGIGFSIVDISDKHAPSLIKNVQYVLAGTHNVWTTDDGAYVMTTDEINPGRKTLKIWDVHDVNNVSKVGEWLDDTLDIIHNVFVKGNFVYAAYYTGGLRIADISNPAAPTTAGYYDTFVGGEGTYNGCWGAYPFFPSGRILAFDMQTGLYVFSFHGQSIGTIHGTIRDAATDHPLSGARLRIHETGQTRWSDPNGTWLWGYASGTYHATVEFPGYTSQEITLNIPVGSAALLNIALNGIATAVTAERGQPERFSLSQNYPNPFNPTTAISYQLPAGQAGLPAASAVELRVYNMLGEEVATLVNGRQTPGEHAVTFNADRLPSGIYFYRLRSSAGTLTRKLLLLR